MDDAVKEAAPDSIVGYISINNQQLKHFTKEAQYRLTLIRAIAEMIR